MKIWLATALGLAAMAAVSSANATLVSLGACNGDAVACTITTPPPNPVVSTANNDVLLAWDERQNVVLAAPLRVDRVFNTGASFVSSAGGGDYFLAAGTIVSSHYIQWDPNGTGSVQTTISLDSQVFAFIFADANLAASDPILGLPGLNYNTFTNRGIESGDTTSFDGLDTAINWNAPTPGDWARLITAYSPTAAPVPAVLPLMAAGFAAMAAVRYGRRRG